MSLQTLARRRDKKKRSNQRATAALLLKAYQRLINLSALPRGIVTLALRRVLSTVATAAAMSKPRLQLILSPAKTMNFSPCAVADKAGSSETVGLERVDELAAVLAKQSKANSRTA